MGCTSCGDCCRYFLIPLPQDWRINVRHNRDDFRKWLELHHGAKVVDNDLRMNCYVPSVRVDTPCSWLTKDNKCKHYADRPDICKRFLCRDAAKGMPVVSG
jgi:Fe-S-cluster containining protein